MTAANGDTIVPTIEVLDRRTGLTFCRLLQDVVRGILGWFVKKESHPTLFPAVEVDLGNALDDAGGLLV